ncbi:adenosine deaminase domain-containing protein 1 isoform X1 [Syngnathus scovelli]|uniref:adenosine deaminase domain-containing protein 1 isoform X1 n=1 Tax=Syngnathus scovelli TaxID=161590 RepID=UPI00210FB488|nr:adenosine deaminase domain-containing protein 1 isoform X1 [Syngnathus scovelli]XP_049606001.1 adenosine deaminase domain-containing protein 1 isoform X1 [Syngnathus scovelli]
MALFARNPKANFYKNNAVGSKELINRYQSGHTHAVSFLHQLAQTVPFHLEFKETVTTGNISGFLFAFCVLVDGVQYKTGMGTTKKVARLKAAELALEDLLPTLEEKADLPKISTFTPSLPVIEESSQSEIQAYTFIHERKTSTNLQIPNAVKNQLSKLINNQPQLFACAATVAAFVIQTSDGYEVVAVGTGNCSAGRSTSVDGRVVHDSHAVVTARRCLMRFLYQHLLMFFSKTTQLVENSIFQHNNNNNHLLSLKSGIMLHLYINQVPTGAAQIPSKLSLNPRCISTLQISNEMGLHVSVEGKVFSIFSTALEPTSTKMVTVSPMDKITQWQVLGYQGALLSHFIEPVYVRSILIGDLGGGNIHGMEMTVNRRTEGITAQLPMFYCMMRPLICTVPSVASGSPDNGPVTYSFNWSESDPSIEVVDGLTGKTTVESPFKSGPALASRLCKAAMLHRFKLVAKEANRQDLLATSSYRDAKRAAKTYQEAKTILRTYLKQQGFGSWPDKNMVSDDFNM